MVVRTRAAYLTAARPPTRADQDGALRTLVRRYLAGFGPASVADVAQFALVPRARAAGGGRGARRRAGDAARPGRTELLDLPGAPRPDGDTPAPPRLMAMWDSVLLAYADRGRVIPPEHRKLVTRNNGDVLPTLLVDGFVAGVWRPVEGGIEATAFEPLPDEAWAGLARGGRGGWSTSWPTGTRRSTAGTATGGPSCRPARPGCCPAENFRGRMSRTGRPLRPGATTRRPRRPEQGGRSHAQGQV